MEKNTYCWKAETSGGQINGVDTENGCALCPDTTLGDFTDPVRPTPLSTCAYTHGRPRRHNPCPHVRTPPPPPSHTAHVQAAAAATPCGVVGALNQRGAARPHPTGLKLTLLWATARSQGGNQIQCSPMSNADCDSVGLIQPVLISCAVIAFVGFVGSLMTVLKCIGREARPVVASTAALCAVVAFILDVVALVSAAARTGCPFWWCPHAVAANSTQPAQPAICRGWPVRAGIDARCWSDACPSQSGHHSGPGLSRRGALMTGERPFVMTRCPFPPLGRPPRGLRRCGWRHLGRMADSGRRPRLCEHGRAPGAGCGGDRGFERDAVVDVLRLVRAAVPAKPRAPHEPPQPPPRRPHQARSPTRAPMSAHSVFPKPALVFLGCPGGRACCTFVPCVSATWSASCITPALIRMRAKY